MFLLSILAVFSIQFSIPEEKIVSAIPVKDKDFAFIVPGNLSTYVYEDESDYYRDYQRSYYALTMKKGGWDCLRHYEILAAGCIPYFLHLEECPPNIMALLPKDLILEAMHLDGVSYPTIDHSKFNLAKYYDILNRLIEHTRKTLTTRKMAEYLLKTAGYEGIGKILYLTQETDPDYLRCVMLIGLKQVLGEMLVDVPKIDHIYKSYPRNTKELYGKGFSYTRIVDDIPVNRTQIEERIRQKEFDLIIYGSVHRGTPYEHLVKTFYPPSKIFYLCGEDAHRCQFRHFENLFLREHDE